MAVFLTDSFTDADDTALTSHTGESGATWVEHGSGQAGLGPKIVGGRFTTTASGNCIVRSTATPPSADYSAEINVLYNPNHITGVGARCGNGTGYFVTLHTAYIHIFRLDNVGGEGGWSALASIPNAPDESLRRVKITVSGSTITAAVQRVSDGYWLDGSAQWSTNAQNVLTAEDGTYTDAGKVGMWVYVGGNAGVDSVSGADSSIAAETQVSITGGPSTGTAGTASSNFTVGADGAITSTIVVTPNDSGAGGTFTPTTVSLTSGAPTGTFTYIAASAGVKTIGITNNAGLTNGSGVTFTAAAAPKPRRRVAALIAQYSRSIPRNLTAFAPPSGAVQPGILTAPTIIGTPRVGAASQYASGTYSGTAATLAVQWTIDGSPVSSASSYTPSAPNEAHALGVVEVATNAAGNSGPNASPTKVVEAATLDVGDGLNSFGLATRSNAVEWGKVDWSDQTSYHNPPRSIFPGYPYSGTKHTRHEFDIVDGYFYTFGGDYGCSTSYYGSGSNHNWKWKPSLTPTTWTLLNEYIPADPLTVLPARLDECIVTLDTRRRRMLIGTRNRWGQLLYRNNITGGRPLWYHPSTNTFEVLWGGDNLQNPPVLRKPAHDGSGIYASGETIVYNTGVPDGSYISPGLRQADQPPVLDGNGREWPHEIKHGHFDFATDKYYMSAGDSSGGAMWVADAATGLLESDLTTWTANGTTQTAGDAYEGVGCFDHLFTRSLISFNVPADAISGQTMQPNAYWLHHISLDRDPSNDNKRRVYGRATDNIPMEIHTPLQGDGIGWYVCRQSGMLMAYGGGYVSSFQDADGYWHIGAQGNGGNNTLFAIPLDPHVGNSWEQLMPDGPAPDDRQCQQMHYIPTMGRPMAFGGLGGGNPLGPEIMWPTFNLRKMARWPTWRKNIPPGTWGTIAATKTLAAVNPSLDPAINPNYPGLAPWDTGGTSNHPIINAWGSMTVCRVRRKAWIMASGGHGDRGGNEAYEFDLQSEDPGWALVRKPTGSIGNLVTTLDDGQESTGLFSDGSPRSTHMWNNLVSHPKTGPILGRFCALFKTPRQINRAWRLNPDTYQYESLSVYGADNHYEYPNSDGYAEVQTGAPFGGDANGFGDYTGFGGISACAIDEGRYAMWIVASTGGYIHRVNLATGQAVRCVQIEYLPGATYAVHLPNIDCLLIASHGGHLFLFDCRTFQSTNITTTGSWVSGFGTTQGQGAEMVTEQDSLANDSGTVGIAWDEFRMRLVMWSNVTNRTILSTLTPGANPRTDPWVKGSITPDPSNSIVPTVPAFRGTQGRGTYVTSLDCWLQLNGVGEPMYVHAFS